MRIPSLLLLGLGLTASATSLLAQENVAPPTKAPSAGNAAPKQKPAKDPFIQTPSSASPTTAADVSPENIILQYDWIDVPRDEFAELVKAKGVTPNANALRGELQTWIAQGKAKLAQLDLLITRAGQRTVHQSVREILYPNRAGVLQAPEAHAGGESLGFYTRECGWITEAEVFNKSDGQTLELNSVPSRVDFAGERGSVTPPSGAQAGDLLIPDIKRNQITSGISLKMNTWWLFYAGGAPIDRSAPESPALTRTLFVRAAQILASSDRKTGIEPTLTLETDWIDVPLSALNEWVFIRALAEVSTQLPEQTRAWLAEGTAKRRALAFTSTGSGQNGRSESQDEYMYPTAFRILSDGRFVASEELTRNLGVHVEFEPIIERERGIAALNIVPRIDYHVGDMTFHRQKQGDRWVADVTRPIFYTMKFTTSLSVPLNTLSLLGTATPPSTTGTPDSEIKTIVLGRVHH